MELHRGTPSDEWEVIGRANPQSYHDLLFNLKSQGMETIDKRLIEMSDPTSPRYGIHMTKEEVDELTINKEGRKALLSYLEKIHAQVISDRGTYISAKAPISVWEDSLSTHFFAYRLKDSTDGSVIIRSPHYVLPTEIQSYIENVVNAITFPSTYEIKRTTATQIVN